MHARECRAGGKTLRVAGTVKSSLVVSACMSEPSSQTKGPDEVFCRDCGELISAKAEICPNCGVRQRDPPASGLDRAVESLTEGGNPFVAAALSAIFPGLGQLYNRELEKGLAVIVAMFVATLSVIVFVGILLAPAVWLYAVWDAYVVADRQREAADETTAREGDDA